jgi:hypothetical protein
LKKTYIWFHFKNKIKKEKKDFIESVKNIIKFFVDFFVEFSIEKLREKDIVIPTRPLAPLTGVKHIIILVFCYKKNEKKRKEWGSFILGGSENDNFFHL